MQENGGYFLELFIETTEFNALNRSLFVLFLKFKTTTKNKTHNLNDGHVISNISCANAKYVESY